MRIELGGNLHLSQTARDRIRERVERKLARFESILREASLMIDDINGPRGGAGIRLVIRTRLNRLPDVVIEETASSIGRALAGLDRAVYNINRVIHKRHDRRRRQEPLAGEPDGLAHAG